MSWWKKIKSVAKEVWKPTVFKTLEKEGRIKYGVMPIGSPTTAFAGAVKWVSPKVISVVKAITPTTIRGKIIGVTSAFIGYGVLKTSPTARTFVKETIKAVPSAPERAVELGGDIGQVIEGEKTFGKDDIIKGAKTAGVVGAVAVGGAYIIPKVIDKFKDREKPLDTPPTAPVDKSVFTSPTIPAEPSPEGQLVKEKPIGVGGVPQTPETVSVTPKKRVYKRRKARTPNIRQSVKIAINNRPTGLRVINKRYINYGLLR